MQLARGYIQGQGLPWILNPKLYIQQRATPPTKLDGAAPWVLNIHVTGAQSDSVAATGDQGSRASLSWALLQGQQASAKPSQHLQAPSL